MRSVNKVILIGNLTRDPELRQTPNGQTVVTFGLATNREWVTRDGRRQSLSEFHDVVAWANLAEVCQKYLKKGKLVYVEGYLKTRSWDTPEGIKRFKTEIVVQDMIMLDKRMGGNDQPDYIPEEMDASQMGDMEPMAAPVKSAPSPVKEEAKPKEIPSTPTRPAPKPRAETAPVKEQEPPIASSPAVKNIGIDDDLGL